MRAPGLTHPGARQHRQRPGASSRPLGQPTRGKTASGRLRRADLFLATAYPERLKYLREPVIDLGYGASPVTTLETLQYLRGLSPCLRVVGVEIDPERVRAALPYVGPGLEFRLGGFNLPLREGERAGVIRSLNVLRQYPEREYRPAIVLLGSYLAPGGILVEGTSDPSGALMAFNLYERGGDLTYRGLVLAASLRRPFWPRDLQAILPKNCIHHVGPGSPLDVFFGDWVAAWQHARQSQLRDQRLLFQRAAHRLGEHYAYPLDLRPGFLRRGFLLLREVPGFGPGGGWTQPSAPTGGKG